MTRRYTRYTKEILEEAAKNSFSVREVMRFLGVKNTSGGLHTWISNRLKFFKVDTSHFKGVCYASFMGLHKATKRPPEKVLVFNPMSNRKEDAKRLREALLEIGREYKCEKCGLSDEWLGQKITLEIHHKNEITIDNRQENLMLLCPNCHSQVPISHKNSASKPKKIKKSELNITKINKKYQCVCCKKEFESRRKQAFCSYECVHQYSKKFDMPKEQLAEIVWKMPISTIAQGLGVSDNAILKRCSRLGIETPKRGYWSKQRAKNKTEGWLP